VDLEPVRNERRVEEAETRRNTSTGFIVQEGALCRGSPARDLEPTAAYRLGIDKGRSLEGKPHWMGKFFQSGANHH
jgi:hypothetical protein